MNTPDFDTEAAAEAWLMEYVDDPCVDNYRFAYLDDAPAMTQYSAAQSQGCCGFADYQITVAGRLAQIGCNYGH